MKGYVLTFGEERAREVFAVCENLGFWPVGATWWFAWNELEIALPAPLTDRALAFDDRWDVARVFAAAAELRLERWGRRRIVRLLVEEAAHHRLPEELRRSAEAEEEPFTVERGLRLLAGVRLELPDGPARGRVEFPRPLHYGGEGGDPDQPLAVAVYLYRDGEGSLRLVRYAELVRVPKDRRTVDIWRVRPYGIDGLEAIPGGE